MKKPVLTYCTNVHPAPDFRAWQELLPFFAGRLGAALKWNPLPMGLWFHEKALDAALKLGGENLRRKLDAWGAATFTFNAFPQGDFHEPEVKKKVYVPDWTESARLLYTQRCAALLADLLPHGGFGSVSTLPLGWGEDWTPEHGERAAQALVEMARFLHSLWRRTGKTLALALEPEPGCALERMPQVVDYWTDVLRPMAQEAGQAEALERHVGICYDTCHQAVQFEEPEEALGLLQDAGIAVHKMQLSSALEFPPGTPAEARARFVEPRFLHQVRIRTPEGIAAFDDLPAALAAGRELEEHPWRVHYHVPLHAESLEDPSVRTTREDMLRALRYALKQDLCPHYEVETYTWHVLPAAHRPADNAALAESIARELDYVRWQAPEIFVHD